MTGRRLVWGALAVAVLLPIAVVGLPVWLIRPFSAQTPDAVQWSWLLRRAAPMVTAVGAVLSLALAAIVWRHPTTPATTPRGPWIAAYGPAGRRAALVLILAVSVGAAWFARQNHFEWMFRPLPDARFQAAAEATDVPPESPVVGVAGGGEALAFPITRIGYHHLVNATLGDVPIVATY